MTTIALYEVRVEPDTRVYAFQRQETVDGILVVKTIYIPASSHEAAAVLAEAFWAKT